MSNNETWIEQAEEIALFAGEGSTDSANKLLEISPTNRTIAGKDQAGLLSGIRLAAHYYTGLYPDTDKYKWMHNLADQVEQYQLTLEGEQNSRRQFMRVMISKHLSRLFDRNKGGLDLTDVQGA